MRKKISLFLVFVLILSFSFSSVFAEGNGNKGMQGQNHSGRETFSDMAGYTWGVNEVQELSLEGKITGYENGDFLPEKSVSQLEAIAMVVRMMDWEDEKTSGECKFDLDRIPEWGQKYVDIADEKGVFEDIDEFDPNDPASRELIAKCILNAYDNEYLHDYDYKGTKYLDDEEISEEYVEGVYAMKALGLMIGDPNSYFNPVTSVRRLEMAMIMHRHRNTHRHRHIINQETSDELRATILIDDLTARYNVSLEPIITIEFSEDVYYMSYDDEFDESEAKELIEFEDDVDFEVEVFEDYWEITPEMLEFDTTYHISLDKSEIVNDQGSALTEQSEAVFTTVGEGDVYVDEITPENEAEEVAIDTEIEIEFSEELYEADNPTDLIITANAEDYFDIDYYDENNWEQMDDEDYMVVVDGDIWTITFDEDLDYNQMYRIDLDKNKILNFVGEDVFEFMTIGNNTVAVEPSGEEVAVDETILVAFDNVILDLDDEEFDETSILDVIKIYVNDIEIDVTAEIDNSLTTVVSLSHGDFLDYSSDYEIVLDEDMILYGIANDTEYEFSTEDAPYEVFLDYDEETMVLLTDESSFPVEGLVGIYIELDEDLDAMCDFEGTLIETLVIGDFIKLYDESDEVIGYAVSKVLDENAFRIDYTTFEAGEYSIEVSDLYYDLSVPKMYFMESPMSFEFELEVTP